MHSCQLKWNGASKSLLPSYTTPVSLTELGILTDLQWVLEEWEVLTKILPPPASALHFAYIISHCRSPPSLPSKARAYGAAVYLNPCFPSFSDSEGNG